MENENEETLESLHEQMSVQKKRMDWIEFQIKGGRFLKDSEETSKKRDEIRSEISKIQDKINKKTAGDNGDLNEKN